MSFTFAVVSPLGYRVHMSKERWRRLVRCKHPVVFGYEDDLAECVQEPDAIQHSHKDTTLHLYYRHGPRGVLCVAVGQDDDLDRIVVSAWFTSNMPKGRELWKRSAYSTTAPATP